MRTVVGGHLGPFLSLGYRHYKGHGTANQEDQYKVNETYL